MTDSTCKSRNDQGAGRSAEQLGECFEQWGDAAAKAIGTVRVGPRLEECWFRRCSIALGQVRVEQAVFQASAMRRTQEFADLRAPGRSQHARMVHGRVSAGRADRQRRQRPGRIHRSDCSRTADIRLTVEHGFDGWIAVSVPKRLVAGAEQDADRAGCGPMSAGAGTGALFAGFLTGLIAEKDELRPEDGPRLGAVVAALVTALLAEQPGGPEPGAPPGNGRRPRLLRHAREFIAARLHDPGLDPAAVAAALNISLRYLHSLFTEQGTSVAAWIKAQRLERARRDLADPAQAGLAVSEIAYRWGFKHPATFTRAFRTAYGTAPTAHRRAVPGPAPAPPRSPGPDTPGERGGSPLGHRSAWP